jgi:hypothetical protein
MPLQDHHFGAALITDLGSERAHFPLPGGGDDDVSEEEEEEEKEDEEVEEEDAEEEDEVPGKILGSPHALHDLPMAAEEKPAESDEYSWGEPSEESPSTSPTKPATEQEETKAGATGTAPAKDAGAKGKKHEAASDAAARGTAGGRKRGRDADDKAETSEDSNDDVALPKGRKTKKGTKKAKK